MGAGRYYATRAEGGQTRDPLTLPSPPPGARVFANPLPAGGARDFHQPSPLWGEGRVRGSLPAGEPRERREVGADRPETGAVGESADQLADVAAGALVVQAERQGGGGQAAHRGEQEEHVQVGPLLAGQDEVDLDERGELAGEHRGQAEAELDLGREAGEVERT